jgi:hypothetical protein
LEDTERRLARVRQAVQTIQRAASPALPALDKRLFAFNREPGVYPAEGWGLSWQMYHEVKAARATSSTAR